MTTEEMLRDIETIYLKSSSLGAVFDHIMIYLKQFNLMYGVDLDKELFKYINEYPNAVNLVRKLNHQVRNYYGNV